MMAYMLCVPCYVPPKISMKPEGLDVVRKRLSYGGLSDL